MNVRIKKLCRAVWLLTIASALNSCAYSLHQLYVGSTDPGVKYNGGGHWVEVEASEFVILGFEMGSEYVDRAYHMLEAKCQGRLAQVTTEHMTAFKFLSYDQKIILKGLCLASKS